MICVTRVGSVPLPLKASGAHLLGDDIVHGVDEEGFEDAEVFTE
jgi:hypothetical protein